MKTRLFAIMFTIAVLAGASALTSQGQSIRVEVPFAFTANNTVYPAGSYRIESASDSRAVWRIRGSRIRRDEFLLAAMLAGSSGEDLRVTFHRYGNRQFLAGFRTSSYEVSLPPSRREKKVQSAEEAVAPAEIINLETVTGGSR